MNDFKPWKDLTREEKIKRIPFDCNITTAVLFDDNLKPNEKLLYGLIRTMSNKEGYSWAKNETFGELLDKDSTTISKWVNALQRQGYVYICFETFKNTEKESKSRRIYIDYKSFLKATAQENIIVLDYKVLSENAKKIWEQKKRAEQEQRELVEKLENTGNPEASWLKSQDGGLGDLEDTILAEKPRPSCLNNQDHLGEKAKYYNNDLNSNSINSNNSNSNSTDPIKSVSYDSELFQELKINEIELNLNLSKIGVDINTYNFYYTKHHHPSVIENTTKNIMSKLDYLKTKKYNPAKIWALELKNAELDFRKNLKEKEKKQNEHELKKMELKKQEEKRNTELLALEQKEKDDKYLQLKEIFNDLLKLQEKADLNLIGSNWLETTYEQINENKVDYNKILKTSKDLEIVAYKRIKQKETEELEKNEYAQKIADILITTASEIIVPREYIAGSFAFESLESVKDFYHELLEISNQEDYFEKLIELIIKHDLENLLSENYVNLNLN